MSVLESLALLRLEYKLDMILSALQSSELCLADLPTMREYESDLCPACRGLISITVDLQSESYIRSCNCKPGTALVSGISGVMATQPPTSGGKTDGSSES